MRQRLTTAEASARGRELELQDQRRAYEVRGCLTSLLCVVRTAAWHVLMDGWSSCRSLCG